MLIERWKNTAHSCKYLFEPAKVTEQKVVIALSSYG